MMVTINQLKTEITDALYFTDEQKRWLLTKIDQAITQINIKAISAPKKVRSIKNASNLMPLSVWEQTIGWDMRKFESWASAEHFDINILKELLGEFRDDMISKGKKYADFYKTFQVYLNRGYLSKKADDCRRKDQQITTIHYRGISL